MRDGFLRCGGFALPLGRRTLIMGVLNVTPDSFSDGGAYADCADAVEHGLMIAQAGADIIDVGGESTRPGAEAVSAEQEVARTVPVVSELAARVGLPVSIDTSKPAVARQALSAGASMVNDVTALGDPRMADVVSGSGAALCLMHMQGTPRTMQASPHYEDVVEDIIAYLAQRVEVAVAAGVRRESIVIDPGIGFGKTVEHNLRIIKDAAEFGRLGLPVLMGPSRKSFIGKVLDLPVGDRLEGTLAAVTALALSGVDIVRVHDVREAVRAARVADAVRRAPEV